MAFSDVPAPATASAVARWKHDPLAHGSYSYIPCGAHPSHSAALGQSVGPRLHFAGEASCLEYIGTVHGAFISGEAAAARLLGDAGLPEELGLEELEECFDELAKYQVIASYADYHFESMNGRRHVTCTRMHI